MESSELIQLEIRLASLRSQVEDLISDLDDVANKIVELRMKENVAFLKNYQNSFTPK